MTLTQFSKCPFFTKKNALSFAGTLYLSNSSWSTVQHYVIKFVKSILFLSARQRNFDGMLGTGLPVSMYTMKPSFLNVKLGYQNPKN
jgi:hypothetical protein